MAHSHALDRHRQDCHAYYNYGDRPKGGQSHADDDVLLTRDYDMPKLTATLRAPEELQDLGEIKPHAQGGNVLVNRQSLQLDPDPTRVIARPFFPGEERARDVVARILELPESEVASRLERIHKDFGYRHRDLTGFISHRFEDVAHCIPHGVSLSENRCQLIGAYFTNEYSLESVALFNPSLVLHPDQTGKDNDYCRVIISLRACGEGHISSIEFRTGTIDSHGGLTVDPPSPHAAAEKPVADKQYEKYPFFLKLIEMGAFNDIAEAVLESLGDFFTLSELEHAIEEHRNDHGDPQYFAETATNVRWLARSNYHIQFPYQTDLSERVVFPVNENESRGIEDARFVRFVYDGGQAVYYATYTAYNGFRILPQLIETCDFRYFQITTLNGRYAQNKGMALFPKLINGNYMMVSRVDGENLFLMESENLHFWNEASMLRRPVFPWEFMQIGNCGSPIETSEGWLLLTHGVGAMREYCIGALLLDMENPAQVIGHLEEPLMSPLESERDGYVPNVVYSCGGMVHGNNLVIPYAMSDTSTGVASIRLNELLDAMVR